MADEQNDKSKVPLTGVFVLVALLGGLWAYQGPLQSSRPVTKHAETHVIKGDEHVQARLWQDPFEAVEAHLAKEKEREKDNAHPAFLHKLRDLAKVVQANKPDDTTLTIMPVLVNGSPYANGVESRLRHRYAVVSALGKAEYIPESGEYIRFFQWDRTTCHEVACPSVIVPVEWYEAKGENQQRRPDILILWLKEQDLRNHPLQSLAELITNIQTEFRGTHTSFKIMGPRSSGSLKAMLREVTKAKKQFTYLEALQGTEFYSSWATAEDYYLWNGSKQGDSCPAAQNETAQSLEACFAERKIQFFRTIGTDGKLARQLVLELKRRHVDLTQPCPSGNACTPAVALISEWDTLYGRTLPRTFVAAVEQIEDELSKEKPPSGLMWYIKKIREFIWQSEDDMLKAQNRSSLTVYLNEHGEDIWPSWAHHYSYLAGLDGELPPKGMNKNSGGTQNKSQSGDTGKEIAQKAKEAPEGRGQLDYLQRLAKTLKQEESTVPGGFKAIGVLSSDVYDKLLILQALRKSFPKALFFTTDLDARLAHPDQWAWTRNLIVASHFGLELRSDLQQPIPPFRDSYQTALFFSTLQAVDDQGSKKKQSVTDVLPRVYEIGRHGPYDLSPFGKTDEPPGIHPERPDLDPITGSLRPVDPLTVIFVIFAIFLFMLSAMLVSSEVWDFIRKGISNHRFWIVGTLVFLAAILTTIWIKSNGAAGEPFVLTEGISVWPTEAIRLLAIFLSVFFLIYSHWSLKRNEEGLREKFPFLPKLGSPLKLSYLQRCIGIHTWRSEAIGQTPVAVQSVWEKYLKLGDWKYRLCRYGLQSAVYILFGFLLMYFFGFPSTPCRGEVCFITNFLILFLSVPGMILLLFYVVDATRLCRRLIKIFIEKKIDWPDNFLEIEADRRGVKEAYLQEWLGIDLIAQRTAVIGRLLYYPFIVLFLMIASRHTYFDHWDFPTGLLIIFGLNAAYAFGNTVALRNSAVKAKRQACEQLQTKLMKLSDQTQDEKKKRQQIEWVIDAITRNREGAFQPFTQHPVFGAIALPSGGYGLVLLMEYLAVAM